MFARLLGYISFTVEYSVLIYLYICVHRLQWLCTEFLILKFGIMSFRGLWI